MTPIQGAAARFYLPESAHTRSSVHVSTMDEPCPCMITVVSLTEMSMHKGSLLDWSIMQLHPSIRKKARECVGYKTEVESPDVPALAYSVATVLRYATEATNASLIIEIQFQFSRDRDAMRELMRSIVSNVVIDRVGT